jgi:hypothetical protein
VIVDVLIGLGVGAELVCCLGLLTRGSAIDRLHYAAAGTGVGPALLAAAVCVQEGLFTTNGLNALVVAVLLALLGTALITATGRVIRGRKL